MVANKFDPKKSTTAVRGSTAVQNCLIKNDFIAVLVRFP